MNGKSKILSLAILLFSIIFLFGSSLAYFTDRKAGLFRGSIGNIDIYITDSVSGKRVFSYDTMNDISFHASNKGSRAMDLKAVVKIQSNMPITQGFTCQSDTVPCYRLFSGRNPDYSYIFDTETTPVFTESASCNPLSGTDTTPQEQSDVYEMTYEFTGLLNGNHPTKENETVPGAEEDDSFDVPLYIFFPSYSGMPGWKTDTKNACYRVTINLYGKQHKNTTDADWKLIDTI